MKKYEDLTKKEKEKLMAYQLLSNECNTNYTYNTVLCFILLTLFFVIFGIVILLAISLGLIGIILESEAILHSANNVMEFLPILGLFDMIIFIILLSITTFFRERDKKFLYGTFGISSVRKDIFDIQKGDLKGITLPRRKLKCNQKKSLKKEEH